MKKKVSSPKRDRVGPTPPTGLAARTFDAGTDEFVLFTWGNEQPAPVSEPKEASLSASERAVLEGIVSGASNREIAKTRGVSERTVANQVASILRKVSARSRFELIRRFAEA